ncbi:MAG: sugar phosphate isomerase/epimerase family protein [Chloroflexota bacterium]
MSEDHHIKLACMSLMWGPIDSREKATGWLDDVVAAGYDGVAMFDSVLLELADEMDIERQLKDRNLQLASVNISIQRDFERLRATCEMMQKLGGHHLVTVGGLATSTADRNEIAELLNQIGEIALTYDVRACYHNHTDHIGETLEETEALMALTDPTKFFGFLDVGHATKDFSGHPVADRAAIFLQRNWTTIDFIEFKDWSEEHNLNTEVGAGECNYAGVFRILKEKNYSGWITVEQNGPTGDKTARACAKASREFIRQGLGG